MHLLSFHSKRDLFKWLLYSNLGELYLNTSILSFAGSLIGVFIPVFLYEQGFSLPLLVTYYILFWGMIAIVSPLAMLLSHKRGMKHVMIFSLPLKVIVLIGLQLLPSHPALFYWIAVIAGISDALYWIPLHGIFARTSHEKNRGTEVGIIHSISQFSGLVAPALGGTIILYLGFSMLFSIAVAFTLLSGIPLLFSADIPSEGSLSLSRMFSRTHLRFTLAFAAEGVIGAMGMLLWPLFIFVTLTSILSVGFVATLTGVGLIIFTLYMGRLTDIMRKETLIHLGGVLGAITWLVRPLATDAFKVFSIGLIDGLVGVLRGIPFVTIFYEQAMQEHPDEFVVFRELALGLGRVSSLGLLLLFSQKYIAGFIMAGFASFAFAFF